MNTEPPKMSEVMKEMSERLLCHPDKIPSSEAAHVALFFANVAWNESVGLGDSRAVLGDVWKTIAAEKPDLWNELKSNDVNALIDELVAYKKAHFADDRRRILTCGMPNGNIRVEWLKPAAPGVDAKWEMHLYGLVRTGERAKAIRLLRETRSLSRAAAEKEVASIAAFLGIA
jgi:hypothetical protein